MDRRSGLIVGGKDESGVDRNTVGESRMGDRWSLNPTSTICKGAKNCTPSLIILNMLWDIIFLIYIKLMCKIITFILFAIKKIE